MAQYANVRGFLDCDYGDFDVMRTIVREVAPRYRAFVHSDEILDLYCAGWVFQERVINWVAHAFYGASIKAGLVDMIREQVGAIAAELPEVEGVFFIDEDERAETVMWTVRDGVVAESVR
jgi:hypothetical protein